MNKIIKTVYDYYSQSEQYKREECLCLPHGDITLTPDYPYYDKGVRYLSFSDNKLINLYLDLSFLTHYSLSYLDINCVFISNELNLKELVIDLTTYYLIDNIYFNIDMSSHVIVSSEDKMVYLDSDLYMNWLSSGLSLKFINYRIVSKLFYNDSNSLSNFYANFNSFYSLDSYNIGLNLILFVESKSELYSFISSLNKVLKSNYKKDNSLVYFRLIVNSFDYTITEIESLLNSLFIPLFDDFSLSFSYSRE